MKSHFFQLTAYLKYVQLKSDFKYGRMSGQLLKWGTKQTGKSLNMIFGGKFHVIRPSKLVTKVKKHKAL